MIGAGRQRLSAGRLRKQVTIQSLVVVKNDDGSATETYLSGETRKASVEPIRGREYFESARQGGQATIRVVMRKFDGLTTKHRILYDTRSLNIESIIDLDERGREVQVMCFEVV